MKNSITILTLNEIREISAGKLEVSKETYQLIGGGLAVVGCWLFLSLLYFVEKCLNKNPQIKMHGRIS
jgi:hypothetical protein